MAHRRGSASQRARGVTLSVPRRRALSSLNLQGHLFEDSAPSPRALDTTVSLASWPGEARECVEIARRIQVEAARVWGPLTAWPCSSRTRPLSRAPRGGLAPCFHPRLVRARQHPTGPGRPRTPGTARVCGRRLSARRFAEYLSLARVPQPGVTAQETWVAPEGGLLPINEERDSNEEPADEDVDPDPGAATLEGTLRAPWRWERLLVDAAVIGGVDRWRRGFRA